MKDGLSIESSNRQTDRSCYTGQFIYRLTDRSGYTGQRAYRQKLPGATGGKRQ